MIMWQLLAQTIGFIFLVAAISKIVDRSHFEAFLKGLGLRDALRPTALAAIISIESFIGVGLIIGIANGATGAAAFAFSACFVAVLLTRMRSRSDSGCGCFGVIDKGTPAPVSITRAFVLSLATGLLLLRPTDRPAGVILDPILLAEAMAGATAYVIAFALAAQVYAVALAQRGEGTA